MKEKTNTADSGLEIIVRTQKEILAEHNAIAEEIARRCKKSPFFDEVKSLFNYTYGNGMPKPLRRKYNGYEIPDQGEIDVYAVDKIRQRIIIFEVKSGENGFGRAEEQLLLAELYLRHEYPDFSFTKVYINARLENLKLRFMATKRVATDLSKLYFNKAADIKPQDDLKKGRERKEYETVRRPHLVMLTSRR